MPVVSQTATLPVAFSTPMRVSYCSIPIQIQASQRATAVVCPDCLLHSSQSMPYEKFVNFSTPAESLVCPIQRVGHRIQPPAVRALNNMFNKRICGAMVSAERRTIDSGRPGLTAWFTTPRRLVPLPFSRASLDESCETEAVYPISAGANGFFRGVLLGTPHHRGIGRARAAGHIDDERIPGSISRSWPVLRLASRPIVPPPHT